MNKLLIIFLLFLYLIFPKTSDAIYDPRDVPNNMYGVHILDVSELESAARLVNSSGGKWGYVTIPIQPSDRDKEKWTTFMNKASELEVIPILRITTIPLGGTWAAGELTDLVDFANFLNELPWPIENRYIIIFNEVNRSQEWGGEVNPEKYAKILKNASIIFKERSSDFFILPAGLDLALPTTETSLNARTYLSRMQSEIPNIFIYIDGWNSHSYPNPAFSASPYSTGIMSIQGYKTEISLTNNFDLPIFITETGWDKEKLGEDTVSRYFITAFGLWKANDNITTVTPFILDARDGDFTKFSLINKDGTDSKIYKAIQDLPKSQGEPRTGRASQPKYVSSVSSFAAPSFQKSFILVFENFFRRVFNLPRIDIIEISNRTFKVEVASTPSHITKGLSGHDPLKDDEGMLFILPYTHIPKFWMKDMLFDLDMIWIKDNKVVDITKNVPKPSSNNLPTYSPSEPVDMVLEINSGLADKYGIKVGDDLIIYEN